MIPTGYEGSAGTDNPDILRFSKSGTTGILITAPAGKDFIFGDEASRDVNGKKEITSDGPTRVYTFADA